jgi:UDP-N-acetylmuramoyl-L-alanyl-D-glutamate--2,6-diaminopimelate ligase
VLLEQLVSELDDARIEGDPVVDITDLAYDTRRVTPGAAFFCVRGERVDGHDLAADAVAAGAVGLIAERPLELPVPQVLVPDVRAALAPLAVRFWGDPSAELAVAGITGTNGKTTTAFLLRGILEDAGRQTGLLGTVKRVVGGVEEEVERTTPEAIDLQRTFRRMVDGGDVDCAMEVSSHALAYGRAQGIHFAVKVFTNLTQDHLDFHSDMEDYFLAKRRLFFVGDLAAGEADHDVTPGPAVVNVDDEYGARLAGELRQRGAPLSTFSAEGADADFRAEAVDFDAGGARFRCVGPDGGADVEMGLPGHFNVANALAAVAAATALGVSTADACASLASASRVAGRFEPVDEGQEFAVLVDYAHTPDSLENVLRAARMVTPGRLICVFGAGGDRDREKRPLMGRIGAELSDVAVVTSDNPRSEDPAAIVEEILAGIEGGADAVEVEVDRRAAIAFALEGAAAGDTVVIAGKGHEQGQEFEGGRKLPFDDREVAREELRRLESRSAAPGAT